MVCIVYIFFTIILYNTDICIYIITATSPYPNENMLDQITESFTIQFWFTEYDQPNKAAIMFAYSDNTSM